MNIKEMNEKLSVNLVALAELAHAAFTENEAANSNSPSTDISATIDITLQALISEISNATLLCNPKNMLDFARQMCLVQMDTKEKNLSIIKSMGLTPEEIAASIEAGTFHTPTTDSIN